MEDSNDLVDHSKLILVNLDKIRLSAHRVASKCNVSAEGGAEEQEQEDQEEASSRGTQARSNSREWYIKNKINLMDDDATLIPGATPVSKVLTLH